MILKLGRKHVFIFAGLAVTVFFINVTVVTHHLALNKAVATGIYLKNVVSSHKITQWILSKMDISTDRNLTVGILLVVHPKQLTTFDLESIVDSAEDFFDVLFPNSKTNLKFFLYYSHEVSLADWEQHAQFQEWDLYPSRWTWFERASVVDLDGIPNFAYSCNFYTQVQSIDIFPVDVLIHLNPSMRLHYFRADDVEDLHYILRQTQENPLKKSIVLQKDDADFSFLMTSKKNLLEICRNFTGVLVDFDDSFEQLTYDIVMPAIKHKMERYRLKSLNLCRNERQSVDLIGQYSKGEMEPLLKWPMLKNETEQMDEMLMFEESQNRLEKAMEIKRNYKSKLLEMAENSQNHWCIAQFMSYECVKGSIVNLCGGFGDRFKGVISVAAAALASDRFLFLNWTKNAKLDYYFEINHHFYNLAETGYKNLLEKSRQESNYFRFFMDSGPEYVLSRWIRNFRDPNHLIGWNFIAFSSNSIFGIDGLVNETGFNPIFESLTGSTDDVALLISAISQTIFGTPTPLLKSLLFQCVMQKNVKKWKRSYRIGVQIRQLREEWNEGNLVHRVQVDQLRCFADEVLRILSDNSTSVIMKRMKLDSILIFVSSDSEVAIQFLKSALSNWKNITIVTSNDTCSDIMPPFVHSDRSEPNSVNETDIAIEMAGTYVDWYALTQMHRLVISRSGFSASASWTSLRPTTFFRPEFASDDNRCPFTRFNFINHRTELTMNSDTPVKKQTTKS